MNRGLCLLLVATACGGSPGAPQPATNGSAGSVAIAQGGAGSAGGQPTDLPPVAGGGGSPAAGGSVSSGGGGAEPTCTDGIGQQCTCPSGITGLQVCANGVWGSCTRCAAGTLTVSWSFPGSSCPETDPVTVEVFSMPLVPPSGALSFSFNKMFDCSTQSVSLSAIAAPQAVSVQLYLGNAYGYAGPISAQVEDSKTTDVNVTWPPPPYPVTGSGMASEPH